jgi:SAM-dependent methyltransferase
MDYEQVKARKRERLLNGLDVSLLSGVEIGPLSRPIIRREDSDVYYVDHCSTEELREKYAGDHEHIEGIEDVDFVWGDSSLAELLGHRAPLDYVVASHVIEHVPDLCGWLQEMADVLKIGGNLLLIVPDKRFTFDLFRQLSSFEEVREAWTGHRRRPGLRLIMDHFVHVSHANTHALWDDYSVADHSSRVHGPEFLDLAYRQYGEGKYVDVHCWVFTPWHFLRIVGRMVEEMGLPFDLRFFLPTPRHDLEFYVQLEKVQTVTTNWESEADRVLNTAPWPSGISVYVNDGIMGRRKADQSAEVAADGAAAAIDPAPPVDEPPSAPPESSIPDQSESPLTRSLRMLRAAGASWKDKLPGIRRS